MEKASNYQELSVETIASRLKTIDAVTDRIGIDGSKWQVKEVGDGNLNLVFIVEAPDATLIVKQALPYVRLVGDSWPLPLYRAYYEHEALVRQQQRAPGMVPEIFHFDNEQALIIMEFLQPHVILRGKLIAGEKVANLSETMGKFCARTAFRGSELSMKSADKKADVGLFSGNVEIPAITEALVFTDPYYDAEMNHFTPELDGIVKKLRGDVALKARVQKMLMKFASNTETMVHGDLHSGSIMSTDSDNRVIDPEFAQYGPMGFDIGMLTANFLMAYFSQPGHRSQDDLKDYQSWILTTITEIFEHFYAEFRHLWQTERTGMLYPASLFEDQGHASDAACDDVLEHIFEDAIAICGIEMHRRVLSLAHNADFETIEDTAVRAPLEARNIMMGAKLILNAENIKDIESLTTMAEQFNTGDYL
ncbi:S-methyl-5-thioribose kinase [Ahrensia marina]|uniref:S-methyl-5-thioribose kinase n=1 Tax=Ahrensia marina TaxID=1514904 RepID=A0A0N0VLU7_9HYPH|nr:S-methyl-5-thioribose kinase [Ahrensia marina]KPB01004.1 methylthioribose kinase [Ahrensia marina]